MAIISDIHEGEQNQSLTEDGKASPSSASSQHSTFSSKFDPSNPKVFLDKFFPFIARESDFLEKETADEVIASSVSAAKEKKKKREEERKKAEQKLKEAEAKGTRKRPNKGNGQDLEKYSWTQTLQEVNINVPVPNGTKPGFLVCEIKVNHLKVGLKGQPPIIDEDLFRPTKPDDCYWSIVCCIYSFDQAKSNGVVEIYGKR